MEGLIKTGIELKRELEGIERLGYELIIPNRKEEWKNFCAAQNTSSGVDMAKQLVEIMVLINNEKSYDYISIYCNNVISHSGSSWLWMLYQIARFHPKGVDFIKNNAESFLISRLSEELEKFTEDNRRFGLSETIGKHNV